jgi:hypothetical protein
VAWACPWRAPTRPWKGGGQLGLDALEGGEGQLELGLGDLEAVAELADLGAHRLDVAEGRGAEHVQPRLGGVGHAAAHHEAELEALAGQPQVGVVAAEAVEQAGAEALAEALKMPPGGDFGSVR